MATTTVSEPPPPNEYCSRDVDSVPAAGALMDNAVIDSATKNGSAIFSDLVNVGICGSGYEMGLEGALQVLGNPNGLFAVKKHIYR